MKRLMNLTRILLGLTCVASMLALQTPSALQNTPGNQKRLVEHTGPSQPDGVSDRIGFSKRPPPDVCRSLPLSFEPNCGQTNAEVKFLSRGSGYDLYLTAKEAVIQLRSPTNPSPRNGLKDQAGEGRPSVVRMKLAGASNRARIVGVDRLTGKSNYFIGNDPKKWRTNIPNFSRVKYENVYPGVDAVFYGEHGQLEYDLRVAPGADFKTVRIAFDGVRRVRLDGSGDLLIATSNGEIRERKPVIYQEADGAKQPVEGGYVIRGEREIGFEVRQYDSNRALVIDPVMVYSTTFGGSYNESANAIAVDKAGNAYIAGTTDSQDFPTVNPFQPTLRIGVEVGIPSDAFVAKLNPSGTALLYSTYLGGGAGDAANGITVDSEGNAYVTGFAASTDFPTTPGAFRTKSITGGAAFITKLNPAGNGLVYSTYLGGPGSTTVFSPLVANVGRGIAVDAEGSAYVTGYTFSESFPLKRAAQGEFNRGLPFNCCAGCLHQLGFGLEPSEDAFVTKLNPSGTGLAYSTYLGGTGQDEGYGIAIDSSGQAYVTGRTCSRDFASNENAGGASDAFVVKLSSSGRELMYSRLLGGSGDDVGNGIVVDSAGNAYVAGQTDSVDFPATQSAFQQGRGGSVSYATSDGGGSWNPGTGLPNSSVNVVAIDPANPSTIYAGLGDCSMKARGVFKSTDGGATWRSSGLEGEIIQVIAIDPKQSSTLYAGPHKSTDGGGNWNQMNTFDPIGELTIDPVTPTTLYKINNGIQCGDGLVVPLFSKTTDGGDTWSLVRNGASLFFVNTLAIDPQNPSALYGTSGNLYESTDSGSSWRVPYEGNRNFVRFAIAPTNPSTIYLSDPSSNIFKSTDRGRTFAMLSHISNSINELVVDPTNSSTLYAALSSSEQSGGVFKSTDGGQTWNATDLIGMAINTLAIDPLNSLRIHAGAHFDVDGFLAKSNPAGSALVYSSYLGTRSPDMAASIGVDETGNAYVTGRTFSDRFPTRDALQSRKNNGAFDAATFTTKTNSVGSAILFSTYLGSNEPSFGSAIAVDAAGKAYVAGTTGLRAIVPSARLPESAHGGFDAFVIKIGSPPRITGASISGKNLIVTGEGFDPGAVILVNGVEQRSKNDQSNPATALIGKKTAKSIAPGQSVTIQVRNSDGLMSEPFSFTR